MKKMFKNPHDIMLYQERSKLPRPALSNYGVCGECGAVYFNKSWHHINSLIKHKIARPKLLWQVHCPACKMAEDNSYEGEIVLENVPKHLQSELYHMITAYSRRAYEEDCQHRIIKINKADSRTWKITLTQKQLTERLARKIHDVFDKADLKITYNNVERVLINFKPLLSLLTTKQIQHN